MNRVGEIALISPTKFYEVIDVIGLDDFIRDRYMQEPKLMIGKVIFEQEESAVRYYVNIFFDVSDYYPDHAPIEKIEPLIEASKKLYHIMSERGKIELLS